MANHIRSKQIAIRDVVPPLALRLWRRSRGIGFHTFKGNWPDIRDVPSTAGGYDNAMIAATYAAAAQTPCTSDDGRGRAILPMLVSQYGDRPVTVLDFGGGACVGLRCIRGMVGDLPNLRYVLVETPSLCRALDGLADGERIRIQTEMPTDLGAPLVVNASSSLQYVPEYADTFNRMLDLHPDALVLSLTSMSDAPTYARQQCNIPRVRLGAWVFERSELLALAAKRNYRCTFCVDHDLGTTHVDAPSPPRFTSMIFQPG